MLFLKLNKPCLQQFLNILTFKESILIFIISTLTYFWPYYFLPSCLLCGSFSSFWNIWLTSYCISLLGLLQWVWSHDWAAVKQQKFIFSQFWKLEVQDQGISRVDSSQESWRKDPFQALFLRLEMDNFSPCLQVIFPLSLPTSKFPFL